MGSIRTHWKTASGAPPFIAQELGARGSLIDLPSDAVPNSIEVARGETLLDLIGQSFARGHYVIDGVSPKALR